MSIFYLEEKILICIPGKIRGGGGNGGRRIGTTTELFLNE